MKVEGAGGTIHVREFGDGNRRLVCLHALALSGDFWDPFAVSMARRDDVRVLAVDARGHGQSTWDGKPFSVDDMADDVAAVIDADGGGAASVVGMSMGGCTALALVLRRPDLVDRLVLADTTACYGPDRETKWAERARMAATKTRAEQIPFQLTRWFSPDFAQQDGADRVVRIFLGTRPEVHAAACVALGGFDRTEDLPAVKAPTLVMVGEADQATPAAMAQTLADGIPGARLEVIPGVRHFGLIERPDVWPSISRHLGMV
jgi:3-oxoadipate enol-lactonase